jgi:TolA-binding protein
MMNCAKQTEESLMKEAEKYEKEEKYDKAMIIYEKLLVEFPMTSLAPEVYFKIAQLAGNLKDFDKCIDMYTRIVDTYPEHAIAPKSQFMIGYIFANEKADTLKAKTAYSDFLLKYSAFDSGMTASAQFELRYLGKDISQIPFLQNLTAEEPKTTKEKAKGN